MFDDETESLAGDLGLDVAFPLAALRHRLDSKIETTRIADEAGVPSVPNVLGRASTYDELRALAATGGVGDDLVVQTPYGDSGQTTFFIASPADWDQHAADMAREELKVMRRINCREAAIEGVITRRGTLVGPLMPSWPGSPSSRHTAAAGAATTSRRPSSPIATGRSRASAPAPWATGSRPRATAATSSSTSSPMSTAARCTSASSTRA
jgi:hypothetical protein